MVKIEMMSPYYGVQMRCKVFDVCVRNCMLSTHASMLNLTLGTFSDMCPKQNKFSNFADDRRHIHCMFYN